jgi:subtilisin family serine protease
MRTSRLIVPLLFLALAAPGPLARAAIAEHVPGELIVRYRAGVRAAERASLVRDHALRTLTHFRTIDAEHVAVADDLERTLATLAADPRVASVERNAIFRAQLVPDDPRFAEQWGLRNTGQSGGTPGADVDATAAWSVFTGDSELRIGVIDTGIDLEHPDLTDNLWTHPGEIADNGVDDDGNGYIDDVHGWDFANDDPDPDDDNGHGTHVAGIIAARGDNGIGVSGLVWRGKLVAIKFLDSSGSGTTANAIRAIEYAVAIGLRITNNSWGGPELSPAMREAIAAAGAAGQLFVAAAGNRAANNDLEGNYPSNFRLPNLISVAATSATDQLASFSNYGVASVDIAAPGNAILSTLPGARYGLLSGTSMAAPLVSATAALLVGRVPGIEPAQLRQRLLDTAEPLGALAGRIGGGLRLNALRAIAEPDTVPPGAVTALTAGSPGSNTVWLEWIATGDDGDTGEAAVYDVRHAPLPIDASTFDAATRVNVPPPQSAGTPERFEIRGLEPETTYWFAVRARDEFGNGGPLSGTVSARTLGPPAIAVLPDRILVSLLVGARDTLAIAVANTAEGTLDFTVAEPSLAFPVGGLGAAAAPLDPGVKGEEGLPGPPVTGLAGGPDAAGYRWIDSRDPGGPAFHWIDITGDGMRVPLTGDDASAGPIDLGFDFRFYGTRVRAAWVSTNGALSFSAPPAAPVNQILPSAGAPPAMIAPFWDDLLFANIERVWVRRDPGRFIVTWLAVPHYGAGGPYTFQAVLLESGEIVFQYLAMGGATLSATAGLQNEARDIGLTVAHNTAFFRDSLAVRILPLPQWLRVTPVAGRVLAGESTDLEVALDARGLTGGAYDATLRILSNDAATPEQEIPVRLVAVGAPDLVIEPPRLDFGEVFAGTDVLRPLRLGNPGTEWLHVSAIVSSDPAITPLETVFSIGPGGVRVIEVRCRRDTPGAINAELRVESNLPRVPEVQVAVTATVVAPPRLVLNPDAVTVALPGGGTASRSVRIENHGASPLTFSARAVATGGTPSGARAPRLAAAAYDPAAKRAPDVHAGATATEGGPDAYGYTWRTSDGAGGPAFEWIDAIAGGERLALAGDDVTSTPLPIGFPFPFYGAAMEEIRVCSNGWISFTSALAAFSNTMLPSAAPGVPENLLAPYWDDFHFAETGHVWIAREAAHTVIQFEEVGRLDDASRPNTFQAVVYPDGRIRFQYLRMKGQNLRSGTVGIQNAARDDGLAVAFNTDFARDSLAVEFTPPAGWFDVTPTAGLVPPGSFTEARVDLRAGGLFGGTYAGHVAFATNDPLAPQATLPCTLRVEGTHALAAAVDTVVFDPAYAGFASAREIVIENLGTAAFELASVTTGVPAVTAVLSPERIEARESGLLRVTVAAAASGVIETSIEIVGSDGAALTLPFRARVTEAPRATVGAPALAAVLANGLGAGGEAGTRRVVIANEGGSPLAWSAEVRLGDAQPGAATALRREAEAALALAQQKGMPGAAGAIGAAGPDAAGYFWTDSRAIGAPAFAWVDMEPIGAELPLHADDAVSPWVALPFPFPFYDAVHDSVRISSNGFLVFGDSQPAYANSALPAAAAPRPMVAPFWDDLDLRVAAGEGRVRVADLGGRFVIAFLDAPRFGGAGTVSFQAVLSSNGDIDFQYLAAAAAGDAATVGIQNGRGDVGLLVAHDAPFLADGLRVSIRRRAAWLDAVPRTGVIAPGASDTIDVRFRAKDHADGDYVGAVHLRTDDPAQPERVLPASLRIAGVSARMTLAFAESDGNPAREVVARVDAGGAIGSGALAAARPRLAGVAVTGAGTPEEDGSVTFRFPRAAVLGAMTAGGAVPLALEGEVPGVAWIAASDTVRFVPPVVIDDGGPPFEGGAPVTLYWSVPPGATVDVHFSGDGGERWQLFGAGIAAGAWVFDPPREGAARAFIELLARDALGYAGSALIGPFEILPGAALPACFAVSLPGPHPARAPVALELAMPATGPARVDVFDLRGARVATLADRVFAAGRHRLAWDGRDAAGAAAPPGIYFVRGRSGTLIMGARVVLLR